MARSDGFYLEKKTPAYEHVAAQQHAAVGTSTELPSQKCSSAACASHRPSTSQDCGLMSTEVRNLALESRRVSTRITSATGTPDSGCESYRLRARQRIKKASEGVTSHLRVVVEADGSFYLRAVGQYTETSHFGARHDPQLFIPWLLNACWCNPNPVRRTSKQSSY